MASVENVNPFMPLLASYAPKYNPASESPVGPSVLSECEENRPQQKLPQLIEQMADMQDVVNQISNYILAYGVPLLIAPGEEKTTQSPFQFIAEKFPTSILKGVVTELSHRNPTFVETACNFRGPDNMKAIHYAAKAGRIQNVVLLQNYIMFSLQQKNAIGQTPLDLAPDKEALQSALSAAEAKPLDSYSISVIKPSENPLHALVLNAGGAEKFIRQGAENFVEACLSPESA
ncbi:ankyrin repeat domain-containing protein [Simkania sp.]|uniref:ankyrin repeat domain-containing protein n=1 Tax=Simkania sp. TaxID=34094 RepID=UPI003B529B21